MKVMTFVLTLILAIFIRPAVAQVDLTGTWQGTLTISETTAIVVQFSFEKNSDGSLSAVLNAPEQPSLTDIPVDSLSYNDGSLVMTLDSISGNYVGSMTDGNLQGTWTQQDNSFPLNLSPHVIPLLTQQGKDRLMGSWIGTLHPMPEIAVVAVFRFETKADDGFFAYLDLPERGVKDVLLDRIELDGDKLLVGSTAMRMKFTGVISGDEMEGEWSDPSMTLAFSIKRGEYEGSPATADYSAEDFQKLSGKWTGVIDDLPIAFRFEEGEGGKYIAVLDSPDQGVTGMPLSSVEVSGNQVILKIAPADVIYTATISATELVGSWSQLGTERSVTVVKE